MKFTFAHYRIQEQVSVLYHNPRCSKSRAALAILEERGVEFEVVRYLETPPSEAELHELLDKLNMTPLELMRRSEGAFKEHGLGDDSVSDEERVRAMAEHPILIERPVFIVADNAVIGRPPERVLELL